MALRERHLPQKHALNQDAYPASPNSGPKMKDTASIAFHDDFSANNIPLQTEVYQVKKERIGHNVHDNSDNLSTNKPRKSLVPRTMDS